MAGRHRSPQHGGHREEQVKTLLILAAIPTAIAVVVSLFVFGKDWLLLDLCWLTSLYLFINAIPKRDRPTLWLAGTTLILESLNILEGSHVRIWSSGQLRSLSSVLTWLTIIPLAWYAATQFDTPRRGWRWVRSRVESRQPPPPTPLDDL